MFSRMATMMVFPLQFDFLKIPNHSRLPNANLGCNFSIAKIKKSTRNDIFSLNSKEMFYDGNEGIYL